MKKRREGESFKEGNAYKLLFLYQGSKADVPKNAKIPVF